MIGIIGVGGVARYAHLPAYKQSGLKCSALCDIDASLCQDVAEEFQIPSHTTDLDAFLADPDVKIVDLAIPPQDRLEVVEKIEASGKPCLVQKPFCVDRDEFTELQTAMQGNSHWRLNMTGRYVSAWQHIYELISSGQLGDMLACYFVNRDWWDRSPGRWDMNVKDYIVFEMSVHHLDLCLWWFGQPESVTGRGGHHPHQVMKQANRASLLLDYGHGSLVTMVDDWTLSEFSFSSGHPFENIVITGSKGCIRANSERVEWAPLGDEPMKITSLPRPGQSLCGPELTTGWFPASFGAAMEAFVKSPRDARTKTKDLKHLVDLTELTFRSAESLHHGNWVACGERQ